MFKYHSKQKYSKIIALNAPNVHFTETSLPRFFEPFSTNLNHSSISERALGLKMDSALAPKVCCSQTKLKSKRTGDRTKQKRFQNNL